MARTSGTLWRRWFFSYMKAFRNPKEVGGDITFDTFSISTICVVSKGDFDTHCGSVVVCAAQC